LSLATASNHMFALKSEVKVTGAATLLAEQLGLTFNYVLKF